MISVIIPVYNVEKYIKDSLESIINQTYKDFEIILVNDGTKDKSRDIAKEVLENSNVSYKIIDTENRGVSAARNTGVENSNGEYFIMIDSDDVISPWFLEDLAKLANEYPDSELVMTTFKVVSENVGFDRKEPSHIIWNRDELLHTFEARNPILVFPTILIKKSYVAKHNIRFDENVRYSEDVQYLWRLFSYVTTDTVFTAKENYNYILHENSTMTASGIDKIMTGYSGVLALYNEIKDMLPCDISQGFVDKWVFAMLHGASKMLEYKDFLTLCERTNAKKHLKSIKNAGLKLTAVNTAFLTSVRLGYLIMRKF